MTTWIRRLMVAMVFASVMLTGCGGSDVDEKQPKLAGPPDPRIKGPAAIGGTKGGTGEATLP
ncbi:hypothetical protein [Tuwongella immobilis]|uniref:Uncharacterized protein n=1 Tax=Tuwongella immobilis TaxID=692036 RepID=A0A6C2YRM7_9BACT|nr:hypothetical protein [Tuwongella immobilis]VIP04011.1 unnamed protein product [Tuwongella immobilis]VTS05389.1 unnamed protein product [Tuwongella immobilis]